MARLRGRAGRNQRVDSGAADGFWDRPMLVNLLADVLLAAGAVLLASAGVIALQRLPVFPLSQVVVSAPLEQVSRAQVEYTARSALAGNFFTVNLEAAQAAFERMPWVRSASLRRLWPDGVELEIEEHRAAARWTPQDGEPRLVSTRGEVFLAASSEPLPAFAGPEGSAPQVLARYREFSERLAAIGRAPVAVQLSAREAWQVRLDDGVVLELGRDQAKHPLVERLGRFADHYAAASSQARSRLSAIGVADMRYPNGFALRGVAALPPGGKHAPSAPGARPRAGVTTVQPLARLPDIDSQPPWDGRTEAA